MASIVVRIARNALFAGLFAAAVLAGAVAGVLYVYAGDLPQVSALDDYAPNIITRVRAADSQVVGEFATERRILVTYDEIAPVLRQAILAAEDEGFERHVGLSVPRILAALARDLMEGRLASGASTLTQQLARKLFLTDEKTWERKIKEALLATQIEKRYTKREIFTMYCNQIYFGHGAYGVEAASRLYFGKPARSLALEEAALIAGIIQGNIRQSPYVNPEAAERRRAYTLGRMAEAGFISRAEAEAAMKRPIVTAGLPAPPESVAPYYIEEVRKHLESRFGAERLYQQGLVVQTPLDVALQRAANRAVDEGLRRIDKRRGYRKPSRNVVAQGTPIEEFEHPRWSRPSTTGDVVPAVVTAVEPARLRIRLGKVEGEILREGFAWTGRTTATTLAKPGDLVDVRIVSLEGDGQAARAQLEQEPLVEGGLVAIENRTGAVIAMVGGWSFDRSKFNRATQALRQLGSTFKPVVYTAAIDRGYTPATVLVDAPVSYPGGAGQPRYEPMNYDKQWEGPITLRRALEQSRNVPAVRLADSLTPKQVVACARRFGFSGPLEPYLSLALGAAESTLIEATSAYSAFPNQGIRMLPYQIDSVVDRDGNVLEQNRPVPSDAIRADTAYVMTSLLQGVVARGTAAKAAALEWPLGGKTGTTDDFSDAWFIGFDPEVTIGVWVGFDQKKPIGPGESGAVAALPIWIDVMRAWIGSRAARPEFPKPGNVLVVKVDRSTGAPVAADAPGAFSEVFIAGTQPGATPPHD